MQVRSISKVIGLYLYAFSATLLIPLFAALYYLFTGDPRPHCVGSFFATIVVSLVCGAIFHRIGWNSSQKLFRREGLAIVVFIWFFTPVIAALPFWISGTLTNPLSAYFEATSGLTTAGGTIMQAKEYDAAGNEIPITKTVVGALNTTYTFYGTIASIQNPETGEKLVGFEAVSRALLLWRSFIQWLGGGGIVILFVAVLPALGVGGKILFHTEMAGPFKEGLTPRIKETAFHLWSCYLGFTFLQIVLLVLTNPQMSWFDSFNLSFGSISTGGFAIHEESIAYYQNGATETIVLLFMILGSLNFSLYYYILRGKFYRLYEPEFLLYLTLLIGATLFVTWQLTGTPSQSLVQSLNGEPSHPMSLFEALRAGAFQIVASLTTTGFMTADYDKWPYVVQVVMLLLMFVGGMSGSTSGGMKTMRLLLLFKIARHKVESLFQPNAVRAIKVGEREIDFSVAQMVLCFFLILIAVSVLGIFLYVWDGVDPETALGLVSSMVNGTGLTFRIVDSCAFLSDFGMGLSCLLMILGRLEFFAILALLVPSFWRD